MGKKLLYKTQSITFTFTFNIETLWSVTTDCSTVCQPQILRVEADITERLELDHLVSLLTGTTPRHCVLHRVPLHSIEFSMSRGNITSWYSGSTAGETTREKNFKQGELLRGGLEKNHQTNKHQHTTARLRTKSTFQAVIFLLLSIRVEASLSDRCVRLPSWRMSAPFGRVSSFLLEPSQGAGRLCEHV